jgi:hypothetical protein
MNLMKEKVKKRMFHSCSKNSASMNGGGSVDSASAAETKLNKVNIVIFKDQSANF